MGFADAIFILYTLGSVCGLIGLCGRFAALRKPSAWLIAAGFALHSAFIVRLFLMQDVESLSKGAFLQILAWSLIFVYSVTWWRLRFAFLGLSAGPLALVLFFSAAAAGNVEGGLPEAMTGAFFVLHLAVLFLNFALVTLGLGSALFFLNLHRKLKAKVIPRDTDAKAPALATVDRLNGLLILAGFPLFTLGLLTGFAWAHLLRGTPVTSDPKEIVSILLWLLYALIFVQRFVLAWRGRKTALMLIALFAAMLLSFIGVNFFMDSHHNLFQTRMF